MELFTQSIRTQYLITLLKDQLLIQEVTPVTFTNVPDMSWLHFEYKGYKIRLIHHSMSYQYGFNGSIIKVSLQPDLINKQVSFDKNTHDQLYDLLKIFATSLGGLLSSVDTDIEGFEPPGSTGSEFMLKQLQLKGVSEEDVLKVLEELDAKKELIKKSNC